MRKYLLCAFSVLLLLGINITTTTASAADPSEMTGVEVQGRWLGSFNTKAPQHSFCIDGFKGYPRASYSWKSTDIKAPKASYLLWRYSDPNQDQAEALSWVIHATNELGHNNVNGYTNLSKSSLPNNIENLIDSMQSDSYANAGPYRLVVRLQDSVSGNKLASGTVRLLGGRGQVISDNFGNRKIKITLTGGRLADGTASRTFYLANGVGSFQYRRGNANTNNIKVEASVAYGPAKLQRWESNIDSAQRVVNRSAGEGFTDSAVTTVRAASGNPSASVRLVKHGEDTGGGSSPLAGARFAITAGPGAPGPNAPREYTDDDGVIVFDELDVNSSYYLHELSAPDGFKLPSPNDPIQVNTGGDGSVRTAQGGTPIVNDQSQFDLALRKYIHAVNGTATGQNGTGTPDPTEVRLGDIVQHRIVVFNQNETSGWAEQVVDYIPEGYDFVAESNPDWTYDEATNTAVINTTEYSLAADPTPGVINGDEPSFSVDIFLRVNSKLYTVDPDISGNNFAEICKDGNDFLYPDIDSTPDCDKTNDVVGGDNIINNSNGDEDDHDFDKIVPGDIPASTSATKYSKTDGVINDTLTTDTTMPGGLEVTFRAYDDSTCSNPVYVSDPISTTEGTNTVVDPDGFQPTEPGKYFWIASLVRPSDGREFFAGVCGDANEMTTVYKITTTATPSMQLGGKVSDIATVSGDLPAGSSIRFNLYGPDDTNCSDTPIYTSDLIPTSDDKKEYNSEKVEPRDVGIHRWVEELVSDDDRTVLTRGECGKKEENSHIWNVSTTALTDVEVGDKIYDTAKVSGSIPSGSKLRFKLYNSEDSNCQNVIWTSDTQSVPEAGYYKSEAYKTSEGGEYYWVEQLLNKDGDVIAQGVCGIERETSSVLSSDTTSDEKTNTPGSGYPDAPPSSVVDSSIPVTG